MPFITKENTTMTNLQQTLEIQGSKHYYELDPTLHTDSDDDYDDMSPCIVGLLHI